MKLIKKQYVITAPVRQVWSALTTPAGIAKWGGGPARMSARVGASFSLWGGDIHGKNLAVKPGELLKQSWVSGTWEKPSTVHIRLRERNGKTYVSLVQHGHPPAEQASLDAGWDDYYFGPLQEHLEQ